MAAIRFDGLGCDVDDHRREFDDLGLVRRHLLRAHFMDGSTIVRLVIAQTSDALPSSGSSQVHSKSIAIRTSLGLLGASRSRSIRD